MGLVDVFARWFLDRVNDIFFTKKDFSVEERIQIIHRFLLDSLTSYKRLEDSINYALSTIQDLSDLKRTEKPTELRGRRKMKLRGLKIEIVDLKKRIPEQGFLNARRGVGQPSIGQHMRELEFVFEQKGFPRLTKQIWVYIRIMGMQHLRVVSGLSFLRRSIAEENESGIIGTRGELLEAKNKLHKLSSRCKKLQKTLIDFTNKVNK